MTFYRFIMTNLFIVFHPPHRHRHPSPPIFLLQPPPPPLISEQFVVARLNFQLQRVPWKEKLLKQKHIEYLSFQCTYLETCYISGYTNVWKQKFTEERKWSNGNCTRLDNKVLRKALIGSWANKPEPWMQSGPLPLTRTKQVKDKSRKEKSRSRATNWRLPYGENVVINGDLKIHAITVNGCGLP